MVGRRTRLRSAAMPTPTELPRGDPVEVPDYKADKVLVALHHRPGMVTSDLAVMVATMPLTLLPILQAMAAQGVVKGEPINPERGSSMLWKLTHEGAKAAVFALHRERKKRPKSTFVGGTNLWTGAKMRS